MYVSCCTFVLLWWFLTLYTRNSPWPIIWTSFFWTISVGFRLASQSLSASGGGTEGGANLLCFAVVRTLPFFHAAKIRNTLETPAPTHIQGKKCEQKSWQNMTPNASKQGNFGSLGPNVCSYFCLVCGGWGFKKSPQKWAFSTFKLAPPWRKPLEAPLDKRKFLRAAPLQNEIALKSFWFENEKWNEKLEKRPETSPKSFKPCSVASKFFTGNFSQFCAPISNTISNSCFTMRIWRHGHAEKILPKKSTHILKSSSEQVFLNNLCWVPDSRHREKGKSSRELFEKSSCKCGVLWYFGIWGGGWASKAEPYGCGHNVHHSWLAAATFKEVLSGCCSFFRVFSCSGMGKRSSLPSVPLNCDLQYYSCDTPLSRATLQMAAWAAIPPPSPLPFGSLSTKNVCVCVCFDLSFPKRKTLMLNKKQSIKTGKNKVKEKGFERKKKTDNPKKERIDERQT